MDCTHVLKNDKYRNPMCTCILKDSKYRNFPEQLKKECSKMLSKNEYNTRHYYEW